MVSVRRADPTIGMDSGKDRRSTGHRSIEDKEWACPPLRPSLTLPGSFVTTPPRRQIERADLARPSGGPGRNLGRSRRRTGQGCSIDRGGSAQARSGVRRIRGPWEWSPSRGEDRLPDARCISATSPTSAAASGIRSTWPEGVVEGSGGAYSVDLISFGPTSRTYKLAPGLTVKVLAAARPPINSPRRRVVGAPGGPGGRRPDPHPPGVHPLLRGRPPRRQAAGQADRRDRPRRDDQHARDVDREPRAGRPHRLQLEVRRGPVPDQHADHGHQGRRGRGPLHPAAGPPRAGPDPLRRPAPAAQGDRPAHHAAAEGYPADGLRPAVSPGILRGPQGSSAPARTSTSSPTPTTTTSASSTGGAWVERPPLGLPRLLRPDAPLPRADGLHPPGGDGLRDAGDLLERRGDARVRPRRRDRIRLRRPADADRPPQAAGQGPRAGREAWPAGPAAGRARNTTSGSRVPGWSRSTSP